MKALLILAVVFLSGCEVWQGMSRQEQLVCSAAGASAFVVGSAIGKHNGSDTTNVYQTFPAPQPIPCFHHCGD